MYDLTIFQPAYRTDRWQQYINSVEAACSKYSCEIIFCGPNAPNYILPDNVKFIHDKGSPARCANIASLHASGKFVLVGSDDALFVAGILDELLDFCYANITKQNIVVPIKYGEAKTWMADEYWYMWYHAPLRLEGIAEDRIVMLNAVYRKSYWDYVGGYDCSKFDTLNWGGHDLTMRLYNLNTTFKKFDKHIMMCDWSPGTKDHSPIEKSDIDNYKVFKELYQERNTERQEIDINNWIHADKEWKYGDLRL